MDELTPISDATLSKLPVGIKRPTYDRASLSPGIVHIGLGNFHRAHQSWYLHRLMEGGLALDWAIIGAGVRPGDAVQRDRLAAQDWLTTLIELDPDNVSAEIVGSMIGYVPVEEHNGALIDQMADPAIRVVSLTVTEGGYFTDTASGRFDTGHPEIQHDIQNPDTPRTAFGAIVAALARRRATGAGPFTGLSCDNLQGNGAILRQNVVELARQTDADLAGWIDTTCSFPNSMVDCIVPATGPAEHALVRDFGLSDRAPVTHEGFRQWVIEDDFCAGRPDWDKAGAVFSESVPAYEAMKLRILNAGHQIIANAGEVLAVPTIAECMADPEISQLFSRVQQTEIVPHVQAVPDMTPDGYVTLILQRFANARIVDTVRRVAFDGSSRHTGFLLPTIRDALSAGTPVAGLALVEALWARMCEGTREDGSAIEPNDPYWSELQRAAIAARRRPAAWLEQSRFYGDLADDGTFAPLFSAALAEIWDKGSRAAISTYLKQVE